MASPTKKSKIRRRMKKAKMGSKRKNLEQRRGTTGPNLPLNMPNANERAQTKATV